ncbi:hypothetical protein MMC27_007122 [Xylographa pallens]|nr:hypothetical protein [Xylographa pallens]
MAPVIPSPTPVTGPPITGPEPAVRRNIEVLQTQFPDVFNLYILALSRFQSTGDEETDKNNDIGTSYFQICGIHGTPFINWQEDPTAPQYNGIAAGYCTHASVLFLPWHRPYLALYEVGTVAHSVSLPNGSQQTLYQYAEDIVKNEFSGPAQQTYAQALQQLRLPYWDWAEDAHLPAITMDETINVVLPSATEPGGTITKDIPNPLYSYQFTSGMGIDSVNNELQSPTTYKGSVRCPDQNGNQHNDLASKQNFAFQHQHRTGIYNLMSVEDFGQFSNQAYTKPGITYDSLEHHHGIIHNYTGSDFGQTATVQNPPVIGNMTDLWSSSFDPIFWLHHANVERFWCIWQALHPGAPIDPEYPLLDRWTEATYIKKANSGTSNLEPFHKTAAHDMSDYFVADELRDISSAYMLGYQYPETPFNLAGDPKALAAYAREQVQKLYGPPITQSRSYGKAPLDGAPANNAPAVYRKEWRAFVRVKRFAIPGSWFVHIFLGEPDADHSKWVDSAVGSVAVFAPRNIATCRNCVSQAGRDLDVSGVVYLTDAIIKALGPSLDEDTVVRYLKDHLQWRVAGPGVAYSSENVAGLTVGVSAANVTYPLASGQLPLYHPEVPYPEITQGKARLGGFKPHDQY